MTTCEVTFIPDGIRLTVESGTLISDALDKAGIGIPYPCGRTGTCGKCAVEIHPPVPEPSANDRSRLRGEQIEWGLRLACTTRINRDMHILITPGLRVHKGRILVDGVSRTFSVDPCIAKTYLELQEPSPENRDSDLARIRQSLDLHEDPRPGFDIELARMLPEVLRESGFKVTVACSGARIIAIEPGDTTARRYGIAVDIGTTTVAGVLFDLSTGQELAQASRLNPQVVFGDDTISRVKYALEHPGGRRELADRIRSAANEIIIEAAGRASVDPEDIYEAVCVGNTVMAHLFLGLDPSGLAQLPFVPVTGSTVNTTARETGIAIHPRGNVCFLPNLGGFVGSDTAGVMLACDYLDVNTTRLAVDVGTNGELALRHGNTFLVCSTAAGPAFEGATLRCGMRAANGAIEHARLAEWGLEYDVIGGGEPIGICGSGVIDLIAVLLTAGIIEPSGRMITAHEARQMPGELSRKLVTVDGQPAFLVFRSSTGGTRDVVITQRDIRQVQLAKGAIRAGINLILEQAGITAGDLEELLLAGAFGNYISKRSAVRIGLLPGIPPERIRFVGNAALTGAKMALLSCHARADAEQIRRKSVHLDLVGLPSFADAFANAMSFPGIQS